ncbi:MAG TPA: hypothetical protein VHX12_02855 [Acidisoma sp.]|jgi:hypothetical protein|nr:hypothetical protein [Acidisoma sp.]
MNELVTDICRADDSLIYGALDNRLLLDRLRSHGRRGKDIDESGEEGVLAGVRRTLQDIYRGANRAVLGGKAWPMNHRVPTHENNIVILNTSVWHNSLLVGTIAERLNAQVPIMGGGGKT